MSAKNLIIKIIGVGNCGGNTVQYLNKKARAEATYGAINTDVQSLEALALEEKLVIGHALTRGLSTGGMPAIGKKAVQEDKENIEALLENCDLLFLITGLGGGLGTGAAPGIAKMAQKQGALVFSFGILPFNLEGGQRRQQAELGLTELRQASNIAVSLPNDLLLQQLSSQATVLDAFEHASEWVACAVNGVIDAFFRPGILNLDFATLRNTFREGGGKTLFGFAQAQGPGAVEAALSQLPLCPLLHLPQASRRADALLINIKGGRELALADVNHISSRLSEHFKSQNNTVIGAIIDDSLTDFVQIIVLGSTDIAQGAFDLQPSQMSADKRATCQQVLFDEEPYISDKKTMAKKKSLNEKNNHTNRGFFFETERTLYAGEDLDVPTYLRRGVKIDF